MKASMIRELCVGTMNRFNEFRPFRARYIPFGRLPGVPLRYTPGYHIAGFQPWNYGSWKAPVYWPKKRRSQERRGTWAMDSFKRRAMEGGTRVCSASCGAFLLRWRIRGRSVAGFVAETGPVGLAPAV